MFPADCSLPGHWGDHLLKRSNLSGVNFSVKYLEPGCVQLVRSLTWSAVVAESAAFPIATVSCVLPLTGCVAARCCGRPVSSPCAGEEEGRGRKPRAVLA